MSRRFTRILVPIDFGAASEAALMCAKELALRFNAHLFLLHVIEDPMACTARTPKADGASVQRLGTLLPDARQQLESALNNYERERFKAAIEVRVGSAADGIGEFARENAIDLIVMGAHERRSLAQAFASSVAERLVGIAPCPVLTTRSRDRTTLVSSGLAEGSGPWAMSEGCE